MPKASKTKTPTSKTQTSKAPASKTPGPSRFRIPNIPGGHSATPKDSTYPIPGVRGPSMMTLADIVGATAAKQLESATKLSFHCIGDSGRGPDTNQQAVAEAMTRDVNPKNHVASPAFLLHLGDVIYGDGKRDLYKDEFYRPYKDYPNKIIAVPGNHDGEEGLTVDKISLEAFLENFCAEPGTQPPLATQFGSQMVNQPGVFWLLETRLLHLVGLYSNAAEDFGVLTDDASLKVSNIGTAQTQWLEQTLTRIKGQRDKKDRRALIFAMHHPPYAQGLQGGKFGHPGNPVMLKQMDDVCTAVGVMPDVVFSGHTHSYERYMRTTQVGGRQVTIPYIVNGAGGHAAQPVPNNFGFSKDGVTYANGAPQKGLSQPHAQDVGFGYLTTTVTKKDIRLLYSIVQGNHRQPLETTVVPLV